MYLGGLTAVKSKVKSKFLVSVKKMDRKHDLAQREMEKKPTDSWKVDET